jgi:hypothetical protein
VVRPTIKVASIFITSLQLAKEENAEEKNQTQREKEEDDHFLTPFTYFVAKIVPN